MAPTPEGVVFVYLVAPPSEHLWSRPALIVAAVLATAQLGLMAPPSLGADGSEPQEFKAPQYLLPLWPAQAPRPRAEHVHWTAIGTAPHAGISQSKPHQAPERDSGGGTPRRVLASAPVAAVPDSYDGSRVYIEPELERPAARDPTSDGPMYPEYLRTHGVEGTVVIRFIIDTAGHADSATLRVMETSHPGFADAVRLALPRMRFTPAELDGRHVPELVMQEFRFVLQHADSVALRERAKHRR
jgi:TonB family protein